METVGGTAERVQSVDRVFQLLEHLADGENARSLSELTLLTGLPMPTIHRLLRSLVKEGYVRQESSKRYALGPRMIRLGESASRMLGSWALPHGFQVLSSGSLCVRPLEVEPFVTPDQRSSARLVTSSAVSPPFTVPANHRDGLITG